MSARQAAVFIVGCKPGGPDSTHTNSAVFSTLREREDFLHKYVAFRRSYESLDLSGIGEWYIDGTHVVGIDCARRIVVYRRWTS